MKASFVSSRRLLPGVLEIRFRPEQKIRFDAGQFIAITIPHDNPDGRGDMREFSISNAPGAEHIEITSSFVNSKSSTYKKALLSLKPGDEVFLGEPMGDFVLPKDATIPLVFVGAGIGVTPYKSIIESLQRAGQKREIQLIYSASNPDGYLFERLWEKSVLDYVPILTRNTEGWNGRSGRLTPHKILEITKSFPVTGQTSRDSREKLLYLAGPQTMIEPIFDGLLELGISRSQLLLDYFPGY